MGKSSSIAYRNPARGAVTISCVPEHADRFMIRVKRVYEPQASSDGARYLVERLWPRGMKKAALPLDGWPKAVAPSDALRRWFGHEPAKWEEFTCRYRAELAEHSEAWAPLLSAARRGSETLLFSARDEIHNNAVALQRFLQEQLTR